MGDALEETLLAVLAQRKRFTRSNSVRALCFGVAARVVAGRRRQQVLRSALATNLMATGLEEPARVGQSEPASVHWALDQLPFKQRVALVAVELQGMTTLELAYALGIASAETLLRDARVAFANALEAAGADDHMGHAMDKL
jgi:DNA-directed RNA polymerase specialized sigma24 family protein